MELLEGKMTGALEPETISTKLQKIATLARNAPGMVLTSLAYHIDINWLREAFRRTRKDGATGVDGQKADEYEAQLESNLELLLERFKAGTYRAPPVRRVQIPKGDGRGAMRPIGIPTFEDKVLQRAVAMVLEAVYEQDFKDCSHGFRPRRSAHGALEQLRAGLMKMGGGWVIELDIRSFYDTLDHGHLGGFLDQRVRDGVLRRVIGKWLNAGVLEGGSLSHPRAGTPQGGVISPLLANVYLHEVLDKWFEAEVKPRMEGAAFLVRYADDAALVFASEQDARRVMAVLPKRFEKYGLTLHPEKTRLIQFRRPRNDDERPTPSRFDMLGFTHYWGRSRKGAWVVKKKTAKGRLARSLRAINQWSRAHRHRPVVEQHRRLVQVLRGHYGYFGVTGNIRALGKFYLGVKHLWRKWLDRRSYRARMPWDRFQQLLRRWPLPPPRVVQSVYRAAKP